MGFPDDMGLDDDESGDSLFPASERPTVNARIRRTEARIKENPTYAISRTMNAVVDIRHEVKELDHHVQRLNRAVFKPSLRPQVQTASVSAGVTSVLFFIYQLLHQTGILK